MANPKQLEANQRLATYSLSLFILFNSLIAEFLCRRSFVDTHIKRRHSVSELSLLDREAEVDFKGHKSSDFSLMAL